MSTRHARIHYRVMDHPKFEGISGNGFALWTWAVIYSGERRTDGVLNATALGWLAARLGVRRWRPYAAELVSRGLWEPGPEPGTYRVHGYLDHNMSAAEIAERAETRRRAAESRWSDR
jgi:hypothetical protein